MFSESITRLRRAALAIAAATAIVAVPLGGCGVKGPLKPAQPPARAPGTLSSEPPAVPAPPVPAREPPERRP